MATVDDASWTLRGEALIGFAHRAHRISPLPSGLHRMPGPAVIMAESFKDSPVGPFRRMAIGEPARLGMRPGYFFGTAVLDNAEARRAGRQYWGFPYELGQISWSSADGVRECCWEDREIEVRARLPFLRLPIIFPGRAMQQRRDGPVIVPGWQYSLMRPTRVEVSTKSSDPAAALAGRHFGVALDGLVVRRKPARHPQGLFSTLRAPLRAPGPEPGLLGLGDHQA